MTRILKDVTVQEVSVVDKAAAPGARIVIRKRDERTPFRKLMDRIFEVEPRKKKKFAWHAPRRKQDDSDDVLDTLAAMIAEQSDGAVDVDEAREWLERHRKNLDVGVERDTGAKDGSDDDDGPAHMYAEMDTDASTEHFHAGSPPKKGTTKMKSHSELMSDVRKQQAVLDSILQRNIVKGGALYAFAKSVEAGEVTCSEQALTKMICQHAEAHGTSFAKLFEANDEDGVALRKAFQVARDTGWTKARQQLMPT